MLAFKWLLAHRSWLMSWKRKRLPKLARGSSDFDAPRRKHFDWWSGYEEIIWANNEPKVRNNSTRSWDPGEIDKSQIIMPFMAMKTKVEELWKTWPKLERGMLYGHKPLKVPAGTLPLLLTTTEHVWLLWLSGLSLSCFFSFQGGLAWFGFSSPRLGHLL